MTVELTTIQETDEDIAVAQLEGLAESGYPSYLPPSDYTPLMHTPPHSLASLTFGLPLTTSHVLSTDVFGDGVNIVSNRDTISTNTEVVTVLEALMVEHDNVVGPDTSASVTEPPNLIVGPEIATIIPDVTPIPPPTNVTLPDLPVVISNSDTVDRSDSFLDLLFSDDLLPELEVCTFISLCVVLLCCYLLFFFV